MLKQLEAEKMVKFIVEESKERFKSRTIEEVKKITGSVDFKTITQTDPKTGEDFQVVSTIKSTISLNPMELKVQPHDDFLAELEQAQINLVMKMVDAYLEI